MPAIDPRPPVRSCVGCRTRRDWTQLVRVTRSGGDVELDGPSRGRGAWLCRDTAADCLEFATRRRGFRRSWRGDPSDGEIEAIRTAVLRMTTPTGEGTTTRKG